MRRTVVTLLVIIVCAIIIIPAGSRLMRFDPSQQAERKQRMNPQQEIRAKQSLLRHDMEQTDIMCRMQCFRDFRQALRQLPHSEAGAVRSSLESVRAKHPHIRQLIWSRHGTPLKDGTKAGELDAELLAMAGPYMAKAKKAAESGRPYESPQLKRDGESYFVLGVPAVNGHSSLIGLVHQDILNKVAEHQKKNLRIVVYPDEKRWRIKATDPDTLNDVKVRDAEDNEGKSHYHKNEVVVKFRKQPTPLQLAQIQRDIHCLETKKIGNTYVFRSRYFTAKQMMDYFKRWGIEYVEPHFLYLTNETAARNAAGDADGANGETPNDVLFQRYQWNLPITKTLQGWHLGKGSENVKVAVIDTGVDLNHEDLQGHLLKGVNFVDENEAPQDDVGHGTHVAGVISALVNNVDGVAGMTWYNRIIPVKVLDQTGAGSTYTVAKGIIWAVDHGAKVINMSLGNYVDAEFLHDAVKYAFDRDVVLIAASGNDNTDKPGYPAAYPEVFAVSATDWHRERASFSNYGDYIDVTAPGVNIASTFMNNQYAALSGTSMASPHVTALAALIRSANPKLKNTEIMDIMRQTAIDLGAKGKDPYYGYGQIDVVKALQYARQPALSPAHWPQIIRSKLEEITRRYVK